MKLKSCVYAIGALAWAIASSASAAIIFEDNFDDRTGNLVGNGWVENEENINDVAILNGNLLLRDNQFFYEPDAAATQISLPTGGYTSLQLSYNWAPLWNSTVDNDGFLLPFDTIDFLFVGVRINGGDWLQVASHQLAAPALPFRSNTIDILSYGPINTLGISFYTDVSDFYIPLVANFGDLEGALIDNVKLAAGTPVPEPASMALLGIGLAGLGALRRRKRAA